MPQNIKYAWPCAERLLLERDLPVSAAGRRELLVLLGRHLPAGESLLVLIEATGVLHLHWAAALVKAGHAVAAGEGRGHVFILVVHVLQSL
jgi:hypothetical protein